MRKDLVVKGQVAAAFWFLYFLSPEPPPVKVGLRLQHLNESCTVRLGQGHVEQTIDDRNGSGSMRWPVLL